MPTATKRDRQRINREARRLAMHEAEKRRKRNRAVRNFAIAMVPIVIAFFVLRSATGSDSPTIKRKFAEAPSLSINPGNGYTANVTTSEGNIAITLDAAAAPNGVNNFVFLARKKFYDGLKVVRVAKGFVFQAGSPDNTQNGGPGYSLQAEVPTAPTDGSKLYTFGTVAMAKTGADPAGTVGSQFFVVTNPEGIDLPADYTIIGQVIAGEKVVKAIGKLYPAGSNHDGPPTHDVTIDQVKIKVAATATPPGG